MLNKMINKKSIIAAAVAVIFSLTLILGVNYANASAADELNKGTRLISGITQNKYGTIQLMQDDAAYDKLFEENLIGFNDDNYVYLLTEGENNTKAILQSGKSGQPLFEAVTSASQAEKYALSVAKSACPEFLNQDYDTFTKEVGEGNAVTYTVELWGKAADNFYTGSKIAMILTSDGYLDSLVYRESEAPLTRAAATAGIDEKAAVDAAYAAVESQVKNVERENHLSSESSETKETPDSDSIISDAELTGEPASTAPDKPQEAYDIRIEDKSSHTVSTYKEYNKGNVEWVVKISDVQTNRDWGNMSYTVNINAETGKVDLLSATR